MVLRFYPSKDATLYERYPTKNTGLDTGLELSKFTFRTSSYNSRILVDFDYTGIVQNLAGRGLATADANWRLKLYATQVDEIPVDYTLYCYLVSQSWTMGVGKINDYPITTEGVSWDYRDGLLSTASAWATESFGPNSTGSWVTSPGGGTWYTSSVATQSFSYSEADVDMDINSLMTELKHGTPFKGFLIKKSDQDESSGFTFASIKFFSKDTSTVFLPTIEARFIDATFTGSLPFVNVQEDYNVVFSNLAVQYGQQATPTIRFAARPRYPVRTFSTSSTYLTRYLVSGSQYAVYNANSDDEIIGFSEYTAVSHDDTGNFFKLDINSLMPERHYRLKLRIPNSGSYGHQTLDQHWIFKVTRN